MKSGADVGVRPRFNLEGLGLRSAAAAPWDGNFPRLSADLRSFRRSYPQPASDSFEIRGMQGDRMSALSNWPLSVPLVATAPKPDAKVKALPVRVAL